MTSLAAQIPLPIRYGLCAVAAVILNLAAQDVVLWKLHGQSGLIVALIVGTITGLVAKYLLDKRWIFFNTSTGPAAHTRLFSLYSVTGVLTTALFWATEAGFNALTPDGRWRSFGAIVGLTFGYFIKYRLDRQFVFSEQPT